MRTLSAPPFASARAQSAKSALLSLALILASPLLLLPASASATEAVNSNWRGLAISGTDPVAYFTEGKPVDGTKAHSFEWQGTTWRFASAENRALFEAEPEKYAPQYGGYCAWAVSQGYTAGIDPEAWTIVGDKLYLNYSLSVQKKWLANRDALIAKGDANWPGIRDD